MNSGTAESGYGFWWPGKENDGATGGGFNPEPMGSGWIRKAVPRGAWYYSAEEDVGYCGALRTHATIVTNDPIFGEFAYGGELTRKGDVVEVIPRDGLRARFHVIRGDQRLHMELTGDGYAKEQPIVVNDALTKIQFTLENRVKRRPPGSARTQRPARRRLSHLDRRQSHAAENCRQQDKPSGQSADRPGGNGGDRDRKGRLSFLCNAGRFLLCIPIENDHDAHSHHPRQLAASPA